jgi:hypothetical protein
MKECSVEQEDMVRISADRYEGMQCWVRGHGKNKFRPLWRNTVKKQEDMVRTNSDRYEGMQCWVRGHGKNKFRPLWRNAWREGIQTVQNHWTKVTMQYHCTLKNNAGRNKLWKSSSLKWLTGFVLYLEKQLAFKTILLFMLPLLCGSASATRWNTKPTAAASR